VVAGSCELVGIGLAAIEIRNARVMWTETIEAPARPEEGPAYGLNRAQQGLEELLVGGRRRRVASIVLIAIGVIVGGLANVLAVPGL
jgi:hypothetical protein